MVDIARIRHDFPILKTSENGKPLVYLDSTASSLKPTHVIDAMEGYYKNFSANIFRGVYRISEEATAAYEGARKKIGQFINANDQREIVFVRNATEAINLVAASWGRQSIGSGDEILTGIIEHHANIVPWQQIAAEKGAMVQYADLSGAKDPIHAVVSLITAKTKLLAITHVSNVLGNIVPVKEIIQAVKKKNPSCVVLVDAAQSVPHRAMDVRDIGCDFLVFSGHKMLGPTGIGVLWGRYDLLCEMPPYQTGGEMIGAVSIHGSTFKYPPHRFEAGTPHIAGAIGLGAAADYLSGIGMEKIQAHEAELVRYALEQLHHHEDITIYGPGRTQERSGVISFVLKGVHPHDLAQILDRDNICIRSGHHCAMPLHTHLGVTATARASFYIYTTPHDIDTFMEGIEKARKVFQSKIEN